MPLWGTFASSQDFSQATSSTFGMWAFQQAPTADPAVPAPVPEPASWALAGLALVALAGQRRRRKPQ